MKIAIEAQRIFRKKKGGMDVVAIETIRHLQKIDKENEYVIYTAPGKDKDYCIEETSNFKIKILNAFTYFDWEQIKLPFQLQKDKPDILHCTSNTAPVWGSVPKVLTIHDIIYLEKKCWPENANLYQRFGNYYRKWLVPHLIKTVDQIVTVSMFEKENIRRYFNLEEWRINVVSNAVNGFFKRVEDKVIIQGVREKYRLPIRFIFFLGNTEPRKNMRNLLKAYARLLKNMPDAPDLVITNISEESLGHVLKDIKKENIRSKVNLVGYVDLKDLPVLYTLADFYLYPSYREGFGLPLLESMACGTAVITSSVSSMPEIAGNAALLVDPNNPESICEGMMKYLLYPELKKEKIELGYTRCKEYTWEKSASCLLKIYSSLYEAKVAKKLSVQFG